MNAPNEKKPRRRLTWADRIAEADARISRLAGRLAEAQRERDAIVQQAHNEARAIASAIGGEAKP